MKRFGQFSALAVVAVFAIALTHVRYPFWGDQALYTIGAEQLGHGAVLYRDFWDLKQPGIYYFFWLAGALFGFGERGVHLLEALYQTVFAIVLIVACAPAFARRGLVAAVPLLSIGVYYALADPPTLTSVEALVGFPLFVCAWLTALGMTSVRHRTPLAVGAGFAAAVVVTFKLVFLAVVLALWATGALSLARRSGGRPAGAFIAAAVAGAIVPLALLGGYFAATGVLGAAAQTWFVDPGRITQILPRVNVRYEVVTFGHFLRTFAPVLVLAAFAVWTRRGKLDNLGRLMVVWLVVGVAVATAQVWSWNYRFFLVCVPLGVLAADGLDSALSFVATKRSRAFGALAALALVILFTPLLRGLFTNSLAALPGRVPLVAKAQTAWSHRLFDGNARIAQEVAFLRSPASLPGDIYVIGDPLYYYYSGRGQAVAINGWSPQLLLPEQWQTIGAQLQARRPPYIYVAGFREPLLAHAPAIGSLLAQSYAAVHHDAGGTWYARRNSLSRTTR